MNKDQCKLEGARVLIVHRDEALIEALTEALDAAGYNAQSVESAAEGLSMVGLFRPRVVVTGLLLEEHDSGFALAEELKRNPMTAEIGVVMVTANREVTGFSFTQEKDGKWMRTDRYFEMPVEPQAIVTAVAELIAASAGATA